MSFSLNLSTCRRIRRSIGAATPDHARMLIQIAAEENEARRELSSSTAFNRTATPSGARLAAMAAAPGKIHRWTVMSFVDSLSPRERAELVALMLLGRDQRFVTAGDFEATCETDPKRTDLGEYLGSKGGLAGYLTTALNALGL